MTQEEKVELLTDTWLHQFSHYYYGYRQKEAQGIEGLMGNEWWVPYFKEVGFISNCNAVKPTEPLTLYRGCEEDYVRGMPWTNSIDTARLFTTFGDTAECRNVYKTIVNPESVLAVFHGAYQGHDIYEYVVNYQDLKEIKEC